MNSKNSVMNGDIKDHIFLICTLIIKLSANELVAQWHPVRPAPLKDSLSSPPIIPKKIIITQSNLRSQ